MSDFFESDVRATAPGAVEREMRRQELRRAEKRRLATGFVAIALTGTLLLGGGFAAFGATHSSKPKKASVKAAAPAKPSKHAKKSKRP
jgi:hypothetical protein